MHYREHSAAVAALWQSQSLDHGQHRGQQKPQKLRGKQRHGRQQTSPTYLFSQLRPAVQRTADERHAQQQRRNGTHVCRNRRRDEQRIVRWSGPKTRKQNQVRNEKGRIQSSSACGRGRSTSSPGEHHEQAIILATVVPGTPHEIERENPGKGTKPEVRQDQRQHNQGSDVDRKDAVFMKILRRVIGAINRRHVVGIVEEQGQSVKGN